MGYDKGKVEKQVAEWKSNNDGYDEKQLQKAIVGFAAAEASSSDGKLDPDDGMIAKMIKASASTDQYGSVNSNLEIQNFADLYSQAKKEGKNPISQFFSGLQNIGENQGELYAKEQVYMLRQMNAEMGLTGQFSKDFRDSLNETIPPLQGMGLGITDIVEHTKEMVDNSGKFAFISTESQVKAAEIATAFGMTMKELAGSYKSFEDVGIGAVGAAEAIGDAGKESLELGLQSQTTIKGLQANVEKLNQYGFQKGIRGLEEMVRKSTEFRMSVDSVFQVADKVFSPEGALEMAANLQVVGGAMGALNNPLEMMYMATNNVEGLQDAIIKSSESLATFNSETGRFEVVGVNLRKAKDMADATGISLAELTKGAIAGNERMQSMNDLSGIDVPEETKRFLTNIAQMGKDGGMEIALKGDAAKDLKKIAPNGIIKMTDMTDDIAKVLKGYQDDFKVLSPQEIIEQQANSVQNIMRDVNQLLGIARIQAAGLGDSAVEALFGMDSKDLGTLISGTSDDGKDYISTYIKSGMAGITKIIDSASESSKNIKESQEEQKKQTEIQSNNQKEVVHRIVADSQLGAYQKELQNNPDYWADLMKSDPRSY